jgi:hypothetical protein
VTAHRESATGATVHKPFEYGEPRDRIANANGLEDGFRHPEFTKASPPMDIRLSYVHRLLARTVVNFKADRSPEHVTVSPQTARRNEQ